MRTYFFSYSSFLNAPFKANELVTNRKYVFSSHTHTHTVCFFTFTVLSRANNWESYEKNPKKLFRVYSKAAGCWHCHYASWVSHGSVDHDYPRAWIHMCARVISVCRNSIVKGAAFVKHISQLLCIYIYIFTKSDTQSAKDRNSRGNNTLQARSFIKLRGNNAL